MPDAVFHLVGANPGPRIQELARRPGIKVSANLQDLRRAVCSAQVYVCAMRYGTGLKNKMLEAMAMRLPIVGYPGAIVGLEGSAPQKHYLCAETPGEFAAIVVSLFRDRARADCMAQAGRDLVEERYSWESRARTYEGLYELVIKERRLRQFTGSN
jgi:glycosyltransferase involved in cell wall biosynthesis